MTFQNCHIVARDVNSDEYHGASQVERGNPAFVVSSSSLREFGRCPSKWREPIKARDGSVSWFTFKGSEATEWGNLFDCFALTPKQFRSRYVVIPEDAPKKPTSAQVKAKKPSDDTLKAIAWWMAFTKENDGKVQITEAENFDVCQAFHRFRHFSEPGVKTTIGERLYASDKQVWVKGEWHDEATGLTIPVQCLIDYVPRLDSELALFDPVFAKEGGDVKTTCNASPRAWDRWALQAGYDVQAAWNRDLLQAAENPDMHPEKRFVDSFRFLLSESHAPWQPGQRVMTDDGSCGDDGMSLNVGRKHYKQLLREYCRCIKTGKWPGYDSTEISRDGCTEVIPNPYATRLRMDYSEMDEPAPSPSKSLSLNGPEEQFDTMP